MELISEKYSTDDIEAALDRVAMEIAGNPAAGCLIGLYEWLEKQLEARSLRRSTIDSVMNRVAKRRAA